MEKLSFRPLIMIENHTLRSLCRMLDQALLKDTYARTGEYRLTVSESETGSRIHSPARGFSSSFGAQRLTILAIAFALSSIALLAVLLVVAFSNPDKATPIIMTASGAFILMVSGLAWLTFHWARAAACEEVIIECDPNLVRVKRLAPKAREFVIPRQSIKEVSVTDQFFVSLELLVITHDFKIHRLLSGLQRRELQDVASIINTYLGRA